MLVCIDISRYLTDKHFDIVWGYPPPGDPQIAPQKSIFLTAQARVLVLFDISRYLTDKYFDLVWGTTSSWGPPQHGAPKNQFFERLNLERQFVLISSDI